MMTTSQLSRSFFSSSSPSSLVFFRSRQCRSLYLLPTSASASSSFLTRSSLLSFSSSTNGGGGSEKGGNNSSTLDYLRTWVRGGHNQQPQRGNIPTRTNPSISNNTTSSLTTSATNNQKIDNRPLLLTGSSYLIPTLRLERYDTPESIQQRLDYAFQSGVGSTAIRSMLGIGQHGKKKEGGWVVPIVLDLSSFQPDGSPHYKPPPYGSLFGFVEMLKTFHICVVGVANPPTVTTLVSTPSSSKASSKENDKVMISMEKEAMILGLPSIMPRGRAAAGARNEMVINVEDVIKLVLDRMEEDDDDEQEEWSLIQNDLCSNNNEKDNIDKEEEKTGGKKKSPDASSLAKDNTSTTTSKDEPLTVVSQPSPFNSESSSQIPQPTSSSPSPPPESTLYNGSVRSGQQITSKPNQSLVILGSVNSGGEVLSDGDIYVFGKLRGRALAGLAFDGDDDDDDYDDTQKSSNANNTKSKKQFSQARIFATSFDPELICIGNTFTTVDDVNDLVLAGGGKGEGSDTVMVSLDEQGELCFERIAI
mmetsp:Transcript_12098/g.17717  ORF Transcript_12098/g.17717 Transcript_12098/m.17717 type:complete len:533 (-) Transcript_12098:235-1833(-)